MDPDLSTCKFHQNLQLLQCAVRAKKRRESKNSFMQKWQLCKSGTYFNFIIRYVAKIFLTTLWMIQDHIICDVAEEDEFFDALESLEEIDKEMLREEPDSSGAEGRLKPCSTLRLFHFPDRLIYEPVTQVCLSAYVHHVSYPPRI